MDFEDFGLTELPHPSKVRRNPYYDKIVNHGFSICVHYSPEDVAEIISGRQKFNFDFLEHDPDELAAFEEYHKANPA